MAGVTLSNAVRTNLLSLQNTSNMLATTQNRLSTGQRVSSAIDDPTAFFTASSLNSRSSDLNRLLDSVSNAVQTVRAADNGITAITKLVEAAQATARQALQKPTGSTTPTTLTGLTNIAADTAATVTGSVSTLTGSDTLNNLGFADGQTITLNIGGTTTTFTAATAATTTVTQLVAGLNANANGSVTLTGGAIVATATANTNDITFGGTATIASVGFNTTTVTHTNSSVSGLTGNLSVQVNSTAAQSIALGSLTDKASLINALGTLTNVTATVNGTGNVTITAASKTDALTITGGTSVGITDATTAAPYNADRATLETEFNNLRTQIDQLAADASYNGNNLLNGDSLSVTFNEDGSSKLNMTGVTYNSAGLGVSAAATDSFQSNASISSSLTELSAAIGSLRQQGGTFGSNLSVVEVRQNFTKNLINTLTTGAAKLTLADSNEEAANLLALQTRQALSSRALSLASRADQQVLQLLR